MCITKFWQKSHIDSNLIIKATHSSETVNNKLLNIKINVILLFLKPKNLPWVNNKKLRCNAHTDQIYTFNFKSLQIKASTKCTDLDGSARKAHKCTQFTQDLSGDCGYIRMKTMYTTPCVSMCSALDVWDKLQLSPRPYRISSVESGWMDIVTHASLPSRCFWNAPLMMLCWSHDAFVEMMVSLWQNMIYCVWLCSVSNPTHCQKVQKLSNKTLFHQQFLLCCELIRSLHSVIGVGVE